MARSIRFSSDSSTIVYNPRDPPSMIIPALLASPSGQPFASIAPVIDWMRYRISCLVSDYDIDVMKGSWERIVLSNDPFDDVVTKPWMYHTIIRLRSNPHIEIMGSWAGTVKISTTASSNEIEINQQVQSLYDVSDFLDDVDDRVFFIHFISAGTFPGVRSCNEDIVFEWGNNNIDDDFVDDEDIELFEIGESLVIFRQDPSKTLVSYLSRGKYCSCSSANTCDKHEQMS